MNGGKRVAEVLRAQGVNHLFALCGGHISPILKGTKDLGIRIVDVRHEATAVFAAASLLVFLIAFYLSVPMVPFEKIGMSLEIGVGAIVMMLVVMLPLVWFAAALLTCAASFAKSYKEAQTYLSFMVLVPTLPVIIPQLSGVDASLPLMTIPSLSQSLLVKDLIVANPLAPMEVVLSIACTSALAALLTWFAVRLYSRERILG